MPPFPGLSSRVPLAHDLAPRDLTTKAFPGKSLRHHRRPRSSVFLEVPSKNLFNCSTRSRSVDAR